MACAFRELCGQLHCVNGTETEADRRTKKRLWWSELVWHKVKGCFEIVMRTGCTCVWFWRGRDGRQRIRTNSTKKIISVTKSVMKICRNLTKMRIGVCVCYCIHFVYVPLKKRTLYTENSLNIRGRETMIFRVCIYIHKCFNWDSKSFIVYVSTHKYECARAQSLL